MGYRVGESLQLLIGGFELAGMPQQTFIQSLYGFLGSFVLGNVTSDVYRADKLAIPIEHRRRGYQEVTAEVRLVYVGGMLLTILTGQCMGAELRRIRQSMNNL